MLPLHRHLPLAENVQQGFRLMGHLHHGLQVKKRGHPLERVKQPEYRI